MGRLFCGVECESGCVSMVCEREEDKEVCVRWSVQCTVLYNTIKHNQLMQCNALQLSTLIHSTLNTNDISYKNQNQKSK